MRLFAPAAAALVLACGTASAGVASAPAGATAKCRDNTYSFSAHHSGTCSHHGGVAVWLDGSSSKAAPKTTTRKSSVAVGSTVLLAGRTRTVGCKLGPNPDRACSPGAVSSGLTTAVLCAQGFHTSAIRNVPQSEKFAVEREYGMRAAYYGSTLEIDHIVPLEIGGSNDIANLYPEKAKADPGYHVKDRLENKLHDLVCSGSLALRAAQNGIAENWQRLYRNVFGTSPVG